MKMSSTFRARLESAGASFAIVLKRVNSRLFQTLWLTMSPNRDEPFPGWALDQVAGIIPRGNVNTSP